MLRFTCGEREICPTIKKSQNIMNMTVGTKFYFKQTDLNCGTKFPQKVCFWSKTGKTNITTDF